MDVNMIVKPASRFQSSGSTEKRAGGVFPTLMLHGRKYKQSIEASAEAELVRIA